MWADKGQIGLNCQSQSKRSAEESGAQSQRILAQIGRRPCDELTDLLENLLPIALRPLLRLLLLPDLRNPQSLLVAFGGLGPRPCPLMRVLNENPLVVVHRPAEAQGASFDGAWKGLALEGKAVDGVELCLGEGLMYFIVLLLGHLQHWLDFYLVDGVSHVLERKLEESHGIDQVLLFHPDDRPQQLMVVLQVALQMQEGRCLLPCCLACPILHFCLSQLLQKLGIPLPIV